MAVDATTVSEPGSPATDWRLHSAINVSDLQCAFFELSDGRGGEKVSAESWKAAAYLFIRNTLSWQPSQTVMALYRLRWQMELVFKRLKSVLGLGHLPKKDPASARGWCSPGCAGFFTDARQRIQRFEHQETTRSQPTLRIQFLRSDGTRQRLTERVSYQLIPRLCDEGQAMLRAFALPGRKGH